MNNFKKSGGFRKSFGGGDRRGGGGFKPRFNDDRPKQMFQATCSECGKSCEVPFRPTGERPVYCRDCFATKGPAAGGRDFNDRGPRPDFSHKKSFGPREDFRPQRPPQADNSGIHDLKKQMETLNSKLERLIVMVESRNKISSKDKPLDPALGKIVKKVAAKKAASKKK